MHHFIEQLLQSNIYPALVVVALLPVAGLLMLSVGMARMCTLKAVKKIKKRIER